MKKKRLGVVIGRFQLLHNGHMELFDQAFKECDFVHVIIGSANTRITTKNPFNVTQRAIMISQSINDTYGVRYRDHCFLDIVDDNPSESEWEASIIESVEAVRRQINPEVEVFIYGHDKDSSSYYIRSFPWKVVEVENKTKLNATDIRESWYANGQQVNEEIKSKVPPNVYRYLRDDWKKDDDRQEDWQYYRDEAKKFAGYPYLDTLNFVCGDAVVECAGHVLLIRRKRAPGKNSWALPGGFKNNNETFFQCAIRELYEETNLRVPENVVLGSVVDTHLFDDPNRSQGIPRSTLAVYIRIRPDADGKLPRANGQDDAAETKWVLVSDILEGRIQLYDDHGLIIKHFTSRSKGPR